MKIRIYSDLHLEFGRPFWPASKRGDEELVVLAGDIEVGSAGVDWAAATFPHVPVVYVLGNHEYYHHHFDTLVDKCRKRALGTNVHILECDTLDIGGIRVLGCTFWTDYALFGIQQRKAAQEWATDPMADFLYIGRDGDGHLTTKDALKRFNESSKWLDYQIREADRPLLVVTHHGPTAATVAPFYQGQISNASFHSNADHLLRSPVRMWVLGHTHYNADLLHRGVRVITNQWGYPNEGVLDFRRDGLFTLPQHGR